MSVLIGLATDPKDVLDNFLFNNLGKGYQKNLYPQNGPSCQQSVLENSIIFLKQNGKRNKLATAAVMVVVLGILAIAVGVLYHYGLLQAGVNALGGNMSTAVNGKIFAIVTASGALATTLGMLTLMYLGIKAYHNNSLKAQLAILPESTAS